MQFLLASAFLAATLAHHYGVWFINLVPQRVYVALWGMWSLIAAVVIAYSLFKRWSDWRAGFLMMLALSIAFIENTMVAVCKSWYAFIYVGDPLFGSTCTNMTGYAISPWLVTGLGLLIGFLATSAWARSKSDAYDSSACFEAYIKPSGVSFWKLLATTFAFPYAGKCWIINGQGYKYQSGQIVMFHVEPQNYRLIRLNIRPNVWAGKRWTLLNNCVVRP